MKKIIAAVLLMFPFSAAEAVELQLEMNRGDYGTIGYVDVDRVFRTYTRYTRVKEDFDKEIRKKEEAIEEKKKNLYALRAEIDKLEQEKELALILPSMNKTRDIIDKAREPGEGGSAPDAGAVQISTSPLVSLSSATADVSVSSGSSVSEPAGGPSASSPQSGGDDGNRPSGPPRDSGSGSGAPRGASGNSAPQGGGQPPSDAPSGSARNQTAAAPRTGGDEAGAKDNKTPVSDKSAKKNNAQPSAVNTSEVNIPGIGSYTFSVSSSPAVIEQTIKMKKDQITAGRAEIEAFQKQAEDDLLDYENRKNKLILGTIYKALKEVSEEEEISVVVDKKSILYGQKPVDLTDRVIDRLKENGEEEEQ